MTGLAHPPAWAASRRVHFEPASPATSAYTEGETTGLPVGALQESGEGTESEGGGPLLFHESGNGVQHTPKVYVIFWGSNFQEEEKGEKAHAMLLKLYEGLSSSAYQGILTQYFDSTSRVSSTVTTASYIDKSVKAPKEVTELSIEEEVTSAINTNKWKPELTAQFIVATAPGTKYHEEGSWIGGCAYHGVTISSSHVTGGVVYDFVPYQGDKPFSTNGCIETGNPSKDPIRKTSKSASHEYSEAATDPEPGAAKYAWRASGGAEIADLCQSQADLELPDGAWVQNEYDDHLNSCSHEDLSPPHAYAITESASSITSGGATLNGITNPEAVETHYYYEYGKEKSYGTKTAEVSAGSGRKNVKASQAIAGLLGSTTYHYRLVAKNSTGTTDGEDHTFTTAEAVKPPENTALPVASPETPDQAVPESTTTGTWTNEPTGYAYQWERCNATGGECIEISGATSSKYTPVEVDVEHTLVVKVTAKNSGGEGSALSKATHQVKPTGQITEYSLPSGSHPLGITAGPDGNLWFTDNSSSKIGKITTSGTITEYTVGSNPNGIAAGPDGNLWFTEYAAGKIGKITTSGTVTEYSLPAESEPYEITEGSDGNLWFTEGNKIGKITTSGTVTEYSLPEKSHPSGITAGPDGNLWFAENQRIAKITTSGTITEYSLPEKSFPEGIVSGPDGNLWFTEEDDIGKITTSGTITEYAVAKETFPYRITAGADGNLWFVDPIANSRIGRITTTGTVTEYSLPAKSRAKGITSGPDDSLWFTDEESNKIGKITP